MSKIIILGHKNPDVDSIISGYLLSSYLRYKKFDVSYVIPDEEIDEETLEILNICSVDTKVFSCGVSKSSKLILVDHHETKFKNEVIAVIDHHPTIKQFNYPVYINKLASSTTKHIYDIVSNECPEYITRRFVELVVIGMAVDTCSFRSSKSKPGDKEWVIEMCEKYDLNVENIMKIGDCITDTSDIYKASIHGYKGYNYFGKSIGTSYIQVRDIDENTLNLILNVLKNKVTDNSLRMWIFIVVDMLNSTSKVYKISNNKIDTEEYDFIISRGSNIMPEVEKLMSKESRKQV